MLFESQLLKSGTESCHLLPAYKLPIDFDFYCHGNTGWCNSEKEKEKCFKQPEFSNFDPRWNLPLLAIKVTLRDSGRNNMWHCPLFRSPAVKPVNLARFYHGYLLAKVAAFPKKSGMWEKYEYQSWRTHHTQEPAKGLRIATIQ